MQRESLKLSRNLTLQNWFCSSNLLYDFGHSIHLIMYLKITTKKIWPDNIKQYFQAHNSIHWNMNKLSPKFYLLKKKENNFYCDPNLAPLRSFYDQDLVLLCSSPGRGKVWWYPSFHLLTSLCSFSGWLDEYLYCFFVCPDWRCILRKVSLQKEETHFFSVNCVRAPLLPKATKYTLWSRKVSYFLALPPLIPSLFYLEIFRGKRKHNKTKSYKVLRMSQ